MLLSPSVCMMCLQAAESANHFFLHYEVAKELMNRFLRLTGVSWRSPFSVRDLMEASLHF